MTVIYTGNGQNHDSLINVLGFIHINGVFQLELELNEFYTIIINTE